MLDLNRITEGFRRLSGLSEDEVNECRELCKGAAEHILRLVPCVSGSNGGKAEFAAAALAHYRYLLKVMSDGTEQVSIGEVSVRYRSDRLQYAEKLYRDALSDIDGRVDDEFVFEGV